MAAGISERAWKIILIAGCDSIWFYIQAKMTSCCSLIAGIQAEESLLCVHWHEQNWRTLGFPKQHSWSMLAGGAALDPLTTQRVALVRWHWRQLMSCCKVNTVPSWQVAPNYINKLDEHFSAAQITQFLPVWTAGEKVGSGSASIFKP